MIETLLLHAPDAAFVEPYIRRALPGVKIVYDRNDAAPDLAVMLSSTDIYGIGTADMLSEEAPLQGPCKAREDAFAELAAGVPTLILRCPDIIATGMNGFPRELAEKVHKGTFFHFPGNESRRSAVHATDIAEVVKRVAVAGLPHKGVNVYNITDGEHPTLHDLAEALAFRMGNKRISNLSTWGQRWLGRMLYGRRLMSLYTTTRTYSSAALETDLHFTPTPVCTYMRTHVYDNDSL